MVLFVMAKWPKTIPSTLHGYSIITRLQIGILAAQPAPTCLSWFRDDHHAYSIYIYIHLYSYVNGS